MTNLEMAYKATTIGLNSCLQSSGDMMLNVILQHEKKKKLYSMVKESRKIKFQLNATQEEIDVNTQSTKAPKDIKKAKNDSLEDMEKGWREKPLHGKYSLTENADVYKAKTHQWLSSSSLK